MENNLFLTNLNYYQGKRKYESGNKKYESENKTKMHVGIQKQLENKNVTSVVLLISNNMQRLNTSASLFLLMWPDQQITGRELCIFVVTVFINPLTHD